MGLARSWAPIWTRGSPRPRGWPICLSPARPGLRIADRQRRRDVHDRVSRRPLTVEDLLNALNGSSAGVLAEINAAGTGHQRPQPAQRRRLCHRRERRHDGHRPGTAKLHAADAACRIEPRLGVHTRDGDDFQIRLKNGTLLDIDVSTSQTIGDVIGLINTAGGGQVTARLSQFGNGIELDDQRRIDDGAVCRDQGIRKPGRRGPGPDSRRARIRAARRLSAAAWRRSPAAT